MPPSAFTCLCQAGYIGRTTRRLSERVREHNPKWLREGLVKPMSSAIGSHIMETNHRPDIDKCFEIIFRVPKNRSRAVRSRILATAEAIAIRLRHPELCAQKNFVRSLLLPWPTVQKSNQEAIITPSRPPSPPPPNTHDTTHTRPLPLTE